MVKRSSSKQRISVSQLNHLMRDPDIPEDKIRQYFVIDQQRSGPFAPKLALNPDTVVVPTAPEARARGDMLLSGANSWARMRRLQQFNDRVADNYKGPIIVSESDSWFQFPILVDDIIDHLLEEGYAIRSVDAAGDTLANMLKEGEYLDAIRETGASIFLFSAGGNDAPCLSP
jgi:hypothetical protein